MLQFSLTTQNPNSINTVYAVSLLLYIEIIIYLFYFSVESKGKRGAVITKREGRVGWGLFSLCRKQILISNQRKNWDEIDRDLMVSGFGCRPLVIQGPAT